METNELSIGGAVTVWKSSSTNRDSLLKKMRNLALGDFVPEPTTRHLALRNALRSVFGVEKVKTLPGFANFGIIDAVATSNSWSGQSSITIKSSALEGLIFSEKTDQQERIESLFKEEMRNIPSADISKMLVKLAYHLGGVPCASGAGGAYWIPKDSMEIWKSIGRSVEATSSTGRARLSMFTTAMDDEAIRAVVGSLEDNIAKELNDIESEVSSGKLKKRALESRGKYIGELRDRICSYEDMLGITIKKLHDAVEHTKKCSVIAAIQSL